MIYGLAIAGGFVLLLIFLALRERMGGGQRKPAANTGDGGAPVSNASMYDSPSSSDSGNEPADECAVDDNSWSDGNDCASDGGSDGGGDGGGGGGGD